MMGKYFFVDLGRDRTSAEFIDCPVCGSEAYIPESAKDSYGFSCDVCETQLRLRGGLCHSIRYYLEVE